jgi:hypothetical protein
MKKYNWILLFTVLTLVCRAENSTEAPDKLVIPWNFFSRQEGKSGLIVYSPAQSKTVKPVRANDSVSFELAGHASVMLELDDRDEDVWSQSVLSAWNVTYSTQLMVSRFDLRNRKKINLKMEGFPSSIHAAVFYKFNENGVSDWIRIYEAVVKKKLECSLLEAGMWICVPVDKSGKILYEDSKIINLQEDSVALEFNSSFAGPKGLELQIGKAKFFSLKNVSGGGPE